MTVPPVVLAPLAGGPSTPELAAAVASAGGLGFVAAGYLSADELDCRLRRARELTAGPLGVNLFVLADEPVDHAAMERYARELEPEARALGVELGEPRFEDDELASKLEVALAADVQVLSTTFGCLSRPDGRRVKEAGVELWTTVTSVAEAEAARDAGAEALVVQGAEAGGHRGSFRDDGDARPLVELIAAIRAAVDLPLVAAGGIGDAASAAAARAAGAAAVQAGTAFLLSPEAGTSEPHRRALAAASGETAFTRAFSGRTARGIANRFMREHPDAPRAYPHVHHLTAPLRAAARAAGDTDRINLWAGTSFAKARAVAAADVVALLGG